MTRTILLLFYGILSMLPFSCAVINCRLACRHCREHNAHPDMLEVYCAMCDECKERRREWLQGPPSLNLRNENTDYIKSTDPEDTPDPDDCTTTTTDDHCDEPMLLSQKITTTTTTTTTTHRPCTPKPHCVKTTTSVAPSLTMPCPVFAPLAIPLCPMCPVMGVVPPVLSSSSSPIPPPPPPMRLRKAIATTSTTESLYFYVGVPKKLLNDLKIRS